MIPLTQTHAFEERAFSLLEAARLDDYGMSDDIRVTLAQLLVTLQQQAWTEGCGSTIDRLQEQFRGKSL